MEEYIKVRYLVDMLEKRLVYQEAHGFHRDAGYTSRFIDSIADIPRADVIDKGEYDNLKWQFDEIDHECDRLEEVNDKLEKQLAQAEAEMAKKIFADIEFGANTNYETPVGTFVTIHRGIYDELKKKYKVED